MKYKFKTKPYRHQRRALTFLLRNRGGGLQVPMRFGKTKVAIDFAGAMQDLEDVQKILVVCPLSVVGVWGDEIPKHSAKPWQIITTGALGYDIQDMGWPNWMDPSKDGAKFQQWRVVNFDYMHARVPDGAGGWFTVQNQELLDFNADLMIVDESHHIGNPTALVSKHAYQLGRRAKFRVFMTGTMFHRKPFFTFGQIKFYDPSVFGTAFGSFKKKVAVFGGYGNYEVLRYQNLKWMINQLKPFVFMEKYKPPANVVENTLYFNLTGRGAKYYREMEKESIITVGGEDVVSPIVLSRHLRCQMIAGGWVKTDTKYRRVGDDKLRIGTERFQQYWDQDVDKFVVGCRFIAEMSDAVSAAKKAGYKVVLLHGGLNADQRRVRIRHFQATKDRIAFISQISAGKEGINLSAAATMCFWSLPESYVEFDQFRNRIVVFDDPRPLAYDFIVAKGTRDEVTYEAMKLKQDVATYIVEDPERVERITQKVL